MAKKDSSEGNTHLERTESEMPEDKSRQNLKETEPKLKDAETNTQVEHDPETTPEDAMGKNAGKPEKGKPAKPKKITGKELLDQRREDRRQARLKSHGY